MLLSAFDSASTPFSRTVVKRLKTLNRGITTSSQYRRQTTLSCFQDDRQESEKVKRGFCAAVKAHQGIGKRVFSDNVRGRARGN